MTVVKDFNVVRLEVGDRMPLLVVSNKANINKS